MSNVAPRDRRVLIGMAGKTHWSAAVEVAADRKSIIFDVAARHQSWPEYLGSNFLMLNRQRQAVGLVQ